MKKLLCLLLLSSVRLLAVNPVPFTETIDFSFKIAGTGSASMTVHDETGSQYILATASGTTIESGTGTAWLCPGKTYTVEFWGAGPSSYVMSFVEPVGYTVYINGVAADEAGQSGGSWFLHNYTVEIRPNSSQVGGMWGSFSGIAVGKSITWSVGLGDLRTGRSAGAIEFKQQDLSNNPTSRDRLYYAAPPANIGQIVVIRNGPSSQTLQQICTPIGFTDIVDVTGGYEIRCYTWTQASWTGSDYAFSGPPWKTIKVESPASCQLKITETEGSVVRVSNLTGTSSSVATGGTVTNTGGYTIHTFNSGGSFVASTGLSNVDYIVVGGGGGGGSGGGGGGGGSVEILTHQSIAAGTYSVTVGSGGGSDTNGTNSTFNGTTGHGGGRGASGTTAPGGGGSSGGGCANNNTGAPPTSGSGSNIHWGGSGDNGSYSWRAGGGGGAGANGHGVGEGSATGYGGVGLSNSFSGSATYYAGGGGGGPNYGVGLPGGLGGGGSSVQYAAGAAGTANTGGGGGGGDGGYTGGAGGSGIVIFRYNTMSSTGASTWTLQEGDGTTVLRTTTHDSNIPTSGQRDDVVIVRTGGTTGTIVAKTKYHYVNQSWGEELDSVIADPDAANPSYRTTTYDYYTTSTDLGNYRKVKSVTLPTGGWTRYEYYDDYDRRGQLKYQYQPWIDTPSAASSATTTNCHTLYYDYTADWTGRYTRPTFCEERVNNTLVGKTTWSHGDVTGSGEPRAYMTVNSYRDASNYHSDYMEAYRADADPDFAGHLYQSKAANLVQVSGSVSRGTYNTSTKAFTVGSSGDHWRELRFHGSTSSSGADSVTSFDSQSCPAVYLIPSHSTLDVTIQIAQGYVYRTATYVYTGSGNFALLTYEDFDFDGYGHCYQRLANNGAMTTYSYTNGQLLSTTDPTGIETDYTYDEIGRVKTSVKKGAAASGSYAAQGDITTTPTYNGANQVTQTVVSSGALSLISAATYDLAGRISGSTAPGSYTTSYDYTIGPRTTKLTAAGGAYQTTETYYDGQTKSVTGTGVIAENYSPAVDTGTGRKWIQAYFGGNTSAWTNTYFDWLGRKVEEWKPQWDGNNYAKTWYYNSSNQLYKFSQPGIADTLFVYDTLGVQIQEGLDLNANGTLDAASSDRIKGHASYIYSWDGGTTWYNNSYNYTFATSGSGSLTYTDQKAELINNPSGSAGAAYIYDIYGNYLYKYTTFSRTGKTVGNYVYNSDSTVTENQISYNGLTVSSLDTTNVARTYGYDALGRQTTSADPRKGTTTTAYISGTSMVSTITDPASATQATYEYDSAGRVKKVTDALSKVCRYEYTSRNEKYHVWGDTDYPVEYGYDSSGHMTTMTTYRGATGLNNTTWATITPGTGDTTTWAYNTATNLLASKTDATTTNATTYTYTVAQQVHTRAWARTVSGSPLTSTYSYSSTTGELTGVSYSDSTPSLTYTYNRLGQSATVADVAGTRTFNYNLGGTLELSSEDLPSYFNSRRVTYGYDTAGTGANGRPTSLSLGTSSNATANQSVTYGYDSFSRLNSLAANASGYTNYTFAYSYTSNSNLVASITNSALGFTDGRTYDSNYDLVSYRTTTIGSTTKAQFAYAHDNLGRTWKTTRTGELYNRYGNGTQGLDVYYWYNDRSELTSEQSKLGGSSTVLTGRDDAYAYDTIGNRSSSSGTTHNSHSANYTTNALNQYTQRGVPSYFDVAGAAGSGTTVTVNGSSAGVTRHGQYFFDGYGLTNTSNPVFTTLAVSDGTTTTNMPAYLQKTAEAFTYDVDGNLLSDGRWNYTYDAENRLLTMETISTAVTAGLTRQKLTFAYDYLGRRVNKIVQSGWTGSGYANTDLSRRFIYNGWNVMAELDHLNSDAVVSNHFWGLDLAGPGQTTGGVGALLMTQEGSNSYLAMYDGGGNLHGIITAGSVTLGGISYSVGDIVAGYEYDAFGQTLRESGGFAASNPYRYSTKYTDVETGLVYYGTRYYSPSMGRFINRDSIEEQGGLNLYAFVRNNGVNAYDILGRENGLWGPNPNGGEGWVSLDGPDGLDRDIGFVNGLTGPTVEGVEHDSKSTNDFGEDTTHWGDWNVVSALQGLGVDASLSANGTLSLTLSRNSATDLTTSLLASTWATATYLANDYRPLPVPHVTIGEPIGTYDGRPMPTNTGTGTVQINGKSFGDGTALLQHTTQDGHGSDIRLYYVKSGDSTTDADYDRTLHFYAKEASDKLSTKISVIIIGNPQSLFAAATGRDISNYSVAHGEGNGSGGYTGNIIVGGASVSPISLMARTMNDLYYCGQYGFDINSAEIAYNAAYRNGYGNGLVPKNP